MDLKFKDYVLVNSANSKKLNMAVDQLADADKTELRIKQTTGCPIILFKQSLFLSLRDSNLFPHASLNELQIVCPPMLLAADPYNVYSYFRN